MDVRIADIESIIRKVRAMVMPYYGNVEHTTKTSINDLVTKLDVEVEEYLKAELGKLYPEAGFVGEETGGDRSAETFWLCDPIDGTVYFVRGIPFCTTMLALIHQGEVVFSVIYDFVSDTLYHAIKGGGAYSNGVPISVSNRPIEQAIAAWELQCSDGDDLALHQKIIKKMRFVKMMCAGYEFILVATGKHEGRLAINPFGKDYDFAPGCLLVAEAGGIVTNIGSSTYDYRNTRFIASNREVYVSLTSGDDPIFPFQE
jgi:myo-inositol-1(or 4)-monophosphatase